MNVLIIGSGGREHAIAWKLSQSKKLTKLYSAPGNPGMAKLGPTAAIDISDHDAVVKFAVDKNIGLVVVGPEDPLAAGLVDSLEAAGIKAFGPSKDAARLEADKDFSKKMMRANSIPTAEFHTFENFEDAKDYIATRDAGLVVKASGLAKGKGVYVCDEPSEAINAAEEIMENKIFGDAGSKIVVEEKLSGPEVSILALVDGRNIYVLETSQDHKPIGEGDTGPNTGGMGAYSPADIVDEKLMDRIIGEILVPTVNGMNMAGAPFRGVLYAGLMLTKVGPKVLEYNVRMGDPETQPILMRLKTDLLEVMLAVCEGRLEDVNLQWDKRPAVCVVISSGGYPGEYEKGKKITGISRAEAMEDVKVFQAGTKIQDGELLTAGGRVLGVTALGENIEAAREKAYAAAGQIDFEGAYFRTDIAMKALK
ncbi:Phosphoribosylamine--glycine ligase [Sedimentisphaera cyanobacteriorum]|uniref:Phosphoribosylamine--glycine ligase n=1 Tax=Sedimentisphaera cyanobacteriorum TaxID=1940790 RepID=A0A1Q2HLJ8_9BACT|nr:phosphoribosylamine--glycine ligase [Sedimentisphaera cyanobacteriorum]AQQ08348.1 Phosphoribosylamine--glycine ligase [Sedimentisphaera cyanobacteriorum]